MLRTEKIEDPLQLTICGPQNLPEPIVSLNLVNQKHVVVRLVFNQTETGEPTWYMEIGIVNIHQASEADPVSFTIWFGPGSGELEMQGKIE